jgi:hypothetical protein
MFRDSNFDIGEFPPFVPYRERDVPWQRFLPGPERELVQDLELPTMLHAMSGEDEFLFEVARKAILSGLSNDLENILYRQETLRDCLSNSAAVRQLYAIAVAAIEGAKDRSWGMSWTCPLF